MLQFTKFIALFLLASSTIFALPLAANSKIQSYSPNGANSDTRPAAKRTPIQVTTDVKNLVTSINDLAGEVRDFPTTHASLSQAFAIHRKSVTFRSDMRAVSNHVKAIATLSEADSRAIFSEFKVVEPTIITAMQTLISKKDAFEELTPLPPYAADIIRNDLNLTDEGMQDMTASFLKAFSDAIFAEVSAFEFRVHRALQSAIGAFTTTTA